MDDVVEWVNELGHLHRIDGPAVECDDGDKEWWVDGMRHRLDGPAIEWSDGVKEWWVAGIRHREGGPAVEFYDINKEWWINGKRHREDGPAIIRGNYYGWFLDGIEFSSKEEWFKALTIECQIVYLFKME